MCILFITSHPVALPFGQEQVGLTLHQSHSLCQTSYLIRQIEPRLLVAGIMLRDGQVFDLCHAPIPLLVWTQDDRPATHYAVYQYGAVDLLRQDTLPETMARAMHSALHCASVWTALQRRLIRQWEQEVAYRFQELTRREREVALHLGLRLTNEEIAGRMGLTEKTIEGYVSRILVKMEFPTRIKLAQWMECDEVDVARFYRTYQRDFARVKSKK